MTGKQFLDLLNKHNGIYGYMYGEQYRHPYDPDEIIYIEKESLRPWTEDGHQIGWCFIWGWPGPDYNIYLFRDYRKTWAFAKEDVIHQEELP